MSNGTYDGCGSTKEKQNCRTSPDRTCEKDSQRYCSFVASFPLNETEEKEKHAAAYKETYDGWVTPGFGLSGPLECKKQTGD
jgi:hypothetical protein